MAGHTAGHGPVKSDTTRSLPATKFRAPHHARVDGWPPSGVQPRLA